MTVAIADVGCHGRLHLVFSPRGGRTIIRDSYCEIPFKITRLLDSGPSGAAHLILMHCTAGVFGGDELECSIHVERGARVRITQQSATKIHPSEGRLARQTTRITVEPGAELCFESDPIIPFAGSRFSQKTLINVSPGSRLAYLECLMAGRIGKSERWAFDELSSETRLQTNDNLLFLDRFELKPAHEHPGAAWVMGTADYIGTGIYFGEGAAPFTNDLHSAYPKPGSTC